MPLKFADAVTKPKRPRATLHKNGRIGFNSDVPDEIDIERGDEYCLAYNEDEGPEGSLYLIRDMDVCPEKSVVKVARAGDYLYIHLRRFFEREGVNYEKRKILYDVEEGETPHGDAIVLERRDVRSRD